MRQENNPRRRVKCTLAAASSLPAAYCMERKGGRKWRENSTTVFNQTAVGKAVGHGKWEGILN